MAKVDRPKRTKNTVGAGTRIWVQFSYQTVKVVVGNTSLESKRSLPEAWEVGHLPVYLNFSRPNLSLTDFTEQELDQLQMAVNLAINAARPICKMLDDRAFEILQSGADLDAVPKRILRGPAPQLVRPIDTELKFDEEEPSEESVEVADQNLEESA